MTTELRISTLYNEQVAALRSYLLSKEQNPELVEDIIQDSFLKLQVELQNKKDIHNPKSWLYRVAHNALMDHFRNADKRPELLESEPVMEGDPDAGHQPEDCLHGIVANLPEHYKKAVFLVDIKGVKQTEAAKTMKLPLSTFKSHVQRGRKLVMQGYMDCCDYQLNDEGHLVGEVKSKDECKVCH